MGGRRVRATAGKSSPLSQALRTWPQKVPGGGTKHLFQLVQVNIFHGKYFELSLEKYQLPDVSEKGNKKTGQHHLKLSKMVYF